MRVEHRCALWIAFAWAVYLILLVHAAMFSSGMPLDPDLFPLATQVGYLLLGLVLLCLITLPAIMVTLAGKRLAHQLNRGWHVSELIQPSAVPLLISPFTGRGGFAFGLSLAVAGYSVVLVCNLVMIWRSRGKSV